MSTAIPGLLSDTLNLVSLARETALTMGKTSQAKKLTPVVEELRSAVTSAKNPSQLSSANSSITSVNSTDSAEPTSSSVFSQSDFQKLLSAATNSNPSERTIPALDISERNSIVKAMAAGKMTDVDIARQLGMTRDEVRLVINLDKASVSSSEVTK